MSLPAIATMPNKGPKDQVFELERIDYLAPEARGRIGGVTAGFPLWKTTMSIGTLSLDLTDQWRGFVAAQRGAQRLFYGFEISRQRPRKYVAGFLGGFSGAASSWSQTTDSNGFSVLTLNGLPSGFQISVGDYVDFRWSTYQRAMVRFVEAATASVGEVLVAAIEPAVHPIVPGGAVAHLDNPCCLMKLMPDTSLGGIARRGALDSGTVVAIQDLIP